MKLSIGVTFLVACLLMGAPAFATQWPYLDVDETNITTQGYDLEWIRIDDGDTDGDKQNIGDEDNLNLTIEYETYGNPLLNVDTDLQPSITMWLNIGGFDQDPTVDPIQYGMHWDFQIIWYGEKTGTTDGYYDDEVVVFGQVFSLGGHLWRSGAETYQPASDVLTLSIPWAQLVDTSANEAVPTHVLLPPCFQFAVKYENETGDSQYNADDEYPGDGEYQNVPEPLTMLGLFMGLGGVGAYIRRRRMA